MEFTSAYTVALLNIPGGDRLAFPERCDERKPNVSRKFYNLVLDATPLCRDTYLCHSLRRDRDCQVGGALHTATMDTEFRDDNLKPAYCCLDRS